MTPQIKKQPILALFGEYYGNKLLNLLGADCCVPVPVITVDFTATCDGFDSTGNPEYSVSVSITYNVSISGYTALTFFASTVPSFSPLVGSGTVVVGNIVANVPVVYDYGIVDNPSAGNYYLEITDSRGNFSAPIQITFPNCPESVPVAVV